MKNVLIINGAKDFSESKGNLNEAFVELAIENLVKKNYDIQATVVDNGYNPQEEVEKWIWADFVIHQFPSWWMEAPWIVKKYIDEVFTEGHKTLYLNDGRTRKDSSKKYGSGGLIQGKKYMISVTWNAPLEAFVERDQFFDGRGIDAVFFPMHKAHEFLGMTRIPTFMCNDVMKNTHFDQYVKDYQEHLDRYFK